MRYLQNKIIIITGAGFSAPANLPIQDRILKEMTEPTNLDILDMQGGKESKRFLIAYIQVAIYLLREYTKVDVSKFDNKYREIDLEYRSNDRVQQVIKYIGEKNNAEAEKKEFNLSEILNDAVDKCCLPDSKYYTELLKLKEELRKLLQLSNIQISLEDIFTLFDKSIIMKENTVNYTYIEIDKLQHAILRLFTYYFSNKVNKHNYKHSDYLEMIEYVKKNSDRISIVTTNWDVLLEEYFTRNEVDYDYKFNSAYVVKNDGKIYREIDGREIPYLKIHGSINWFRCLKCGTLQVHGANVCGKYLFEDDVKEQCSKCGQVASVEKVQIKPEIITPTMLKSINSQLYNNLWQNVAYELQQAEKIIFCGYSLPIADYEFRYLLKQNIGVKTKIDVVLYHNDDPKRSSDDKIINFLPEKRYKDLFPNNDCNFFYEGFGSYFQNKNY